MRTLQTRKIQSEQTTQTSNTEGVSLMQVILLERIGRLGQMGDVVKVKDGYARNFLLPQGKALRATKDNQTEFEKRRVVLEANGLSRPKTTLQ